MNRPPVLFLAAALTAVALAGCGSASSSTAVTQTFPASPSTTAAVPSPSQSHDPGPFPSQSHDDTQACQAFQNFLTNRVAPSVKAVVDSSAHADSHLQALIHKWSADEQASDLGGVGAYQKAIKSWCAAHGAPLSA